MPLGLHVGGGSATRSNNVANQKYKRASMPTMASFDTRTNDYTNSFFSENNDLLMKDLPA